MSTKPKPPRRRTAPPNGHLTLAKLEQLLEGSRVVPCGPPLGDVTVYVLGLKEKQAVQELLRRFQDESGAPGGGTLDLTDEQAEEFGVELLCRCILDEEGRATFDSRQGRLLLARLPLLAFSELVEAAADLNGFNPKKKGRT